MTPHQGKISANVSKLLEWYLKNARDLPWRHTTDPYAVWISEIMLQQTQAGTVIAFWNRWMKALPTVRHLAKARPETVLKLWEGLGYYRRARDLQKAARLIMDSHGGGFPATHAQVLALPGVGPYTAGAICSIAFNQPAPILDGNVIRVLSRFHGVRQPASSAGTQRRLWSLARLWVETAAALGAPEGSTSPPPASSPRCSHLNQGLMELGALVCVPRTPRCDVCPLRTGCAARRLGLQARIPRQAPRPKAAAKQFAAAIVRHQNQFLVRQRPEGAINAGFWEFPNVECSSPEAGSALAGHLRGELRLSVSGLKHLGRIQHSITRYRIRLDAFAARLSRKPRRVPLSWKWVDKPGLARLPLASAHRKLSRWIA